MERCCRMRVSPVVAGDKTYTLTGARMTPSSQDYRLIPLTQGQFAKVSPEDFEWLSQWKWHARWNKCTRSFYALRAGRISEWPHFRNSVQMQRQILGLGYGNPLRADHINSDTLDNRRLNLRPATKAQNTQNCRVRCDNKTGLKGAYWSKQKKKWHSAIHANGKLNHLGHYMTAEEAHEAYKAAAKKFFGEFARFA